MQVAKGAPKDSFPHQEVHTLEGVAQTHLHGMLFAAVAEGGARVSHQAHGAAVLVLQVGVRAVQRGALGQVVLIAQANWSAFCASRLAMLWRS